MAMTMPIQSEEKKKQSIDTILKNGAPIYQLKSIQPIQHSGTNVKYTYYRKQLSWYEQIGNKKEP